MSAKKKAPAPSTGPSEYEIQRTDNRQIRAFHMVGGKLRSYDVMLRIGQVFRIVPDDAGSLPICMFRKEMQRTFFNEHFNHSPAPEQPAADDTAEA